MNICLSATDRITTHKKADIKDLNNTTRQQDLIDTYRVLNQTKAEEKKNKFLYNSHQEKSCLRP